MVKTKLEKFRSRWCRWLGQMTRVDRNTWMELLNCNWSGWANKVLDRVDHQYPRLHSTSNSLDVCYIYGEAIRIATMEELRELDNIYCQEVLIPRMEAKDI